MTEPIADHRLDALLAGIIARAQGRGETPICLALPNRLSETQIARVLAMTTIAGLACGNEGRETDHARLGAVGGQGDWRLPDGTYRTLYYVGPPWRLSLAMLREAARHGVSDLKCQLPGRQHRGGALHGGWVSLPLDRLARLKTPLRWLNARGLDGHEWLGRARGGLAARIARRWPATRPLASRIAGSAGLGGSPLEESVRALIASQATPRREMVADLFKGRIVLVCGSLSPGGAERQVAMTAAGLKAVGIADVWLLCHTLAAGPPHHHDFHRARAEMAGVRVAEIERRPAGERRKPAPIASGWLPDGILTDIANLKAAFDKLQPAVVHAWLDWDGVRAGIAAVLAGVPRVVISGRNLNPSRFVFHQPIMRPAYRALFDEPSVTFLNNSDAGARDYAHWLGVEPDRIGVIANAVALEGFDPPTTEAERAARTRLGLPDDAPVIGGVFRLAPEKRPLLWLDMAAELARRHPNARFVIFGTGPLEARARARATRLGLGGRVTFAGVTPDIASAMAAMDVVVLTSETEGLPNVVLEAQALGRPVVTTRAGGVAEALREGETGLVVDEATASRLADAVDRALFDMSWRAHAQVAGPRFIRETFSIARMITETLDVYGGGIGCGSAMNRPSRPT